MKKSLFDALETCLQAMEKGETLDAVLSRYPDLAGELRPLLELAQRARTPGGSELPVGAISRGRVRVLSAAADLRAARSPRFFPGRSWRTALITLVIVLALVLGGNGLLVASAQSLPGDPLYVFKRSIEQTQLFLLFDSAQRQALQVSFSQRRVDETKSLITINRVEPVEFDGVVASQTEDGWLVSGIPVVITSQTLVDGSLQIGDSVTVSGETNSDGRVEASHLFPVKTNSDHPLGPGQLATGTWVPGGTREFDHQGTRSFDQGTLQPAEQHWDPTGTGGQHTPEPTDSHWSGDGSGGTPTLQPTGGGDDYHH
jgi:hypothetical protein